MYSKLLNSSWKALSFYLFKLTQPLTVSAVQLLYTVKEKGGKPDRKPYFLLYRNLKSENSQDYTQKPQRNCTFMNSESGEEAQDPRELELYDCHNLHPNDALYSTDS
jgi:hypothetical protein